MARSEYPTCHLGITEAPNFSALIREDGSHRHTSVTIILSIGVPRIAKYDAGSVRGTLIEINIFNS